jgi:hypothetical protein
VNEHLNKACFKAPHWERICGFRGVGFGLANPENFNRLTEPKNEVNKEILETKYKASKGGEHLQRYSGAT